MNLVKFRVLDGWSGDELSIEQMATSEVYINIEQIVSIKEVIFFKTVSVHQFPNMTTEALHTKLTMLILTNNDVYKVPTSSFFVLMAIARSKRKYI